MERQNALEIAASSILKEHRKGTKRPHPQSTPAGSDSDESVLVGNVIPRGNVPARTGNEGAVHTCLSCEQVWPARMAWPPQAVNVINGKRITIEDDEVEERTVAENTHSTRRRLGEDSSTAATQPATRTAASNDLLDHVTVVEGRTTEKRLENNQTLVDALYTRSKDIPDIANILRAHVTRNEKIDTVEQQRKEADAAQHAAAKEEQRRRAQARRAATKAGRERKARAQYPTYSTGREEARGGQ